MYVGIFRLPKNPEFVHQNLGALNREGRRGRQVEGGVGWPMCQLRSVRGRWIIMGFNGWDCDTWDVVVSSMHLSWVPYFGGFPVLVKKIEGWGEMGVVEKWHISTTSWL